MKRIAYIFAICAAALVSCSKPELEAGDAMAPGLNVTLRMAGPATKAGSEMPGVAELNENKIESLVYFVFDGRDDSAKLIFKDTKTVGVDVAASGINVNLALSEEIFSDIMYATGRSRLYVVANATDAFKDLKTVSEIKTKLLELSKKEGKQDSFVMSGTTDVIGEVAAVGDKRRAVANVELKRLLAKVSLKVGVDKIYEKQVKADGTELAEDETSDVKVRWTSNMNQVRVLFSGLESRAMIAPDASFESALFDCEVKTFTPTNETTSSYECVTSVPYYSYPRTWTIADESQPYFLISVPWTSELIGTATGDWFQPTTATTYYKVILGGSFASNNWYAISVALKGLGSLTPGSAVEISPLDLTVADWKNSVEGETSFHTEARFQDARVLDIPQDVVTLYNQNEARVSFISSHPCVVESVSLSYKDYSQASMPDVTENNVTGVVSIDGYSLVFNHVLNNDINQKPFDYRTLTYNIKICHSDDATYHDEITIVQVPSLMIAGSYNSAGTKGTTTFLNGTKGGTSGYATGDFGSIMGDIGSANNSNPNMYIVSVSTLNNYKLTGGTIYASVGDPRTFAVDNVGLLSGTMAKSAAAVEGGERRIQYYLPADAEKNNVIAPKLRVASSHGATLTLNKANALKRCATYQEDGYPAGRWRIPTRAEVEFISTLSNEGLITLLFGDGKTTTEYWCADGYITVGGKTVTWSETTSTTVSYAVRCVYDEWYWENTDYPTVDKGTFTWGDMPR